MQLTYKQKRWMADYELALRQGFFFYKGEKVLLQDIEVEDWYPEYIKEDKVIYDRKFFRAQGATGGKLGGKKGGDSTAKKGRQYFVDIANKRWSNPNK